jgi:hypothetical protein
MPRVSANARRLIRKLALPGLICCSLMGAGCTTYVPGGVNTTSTAKVAASDGSGSPSAASYPPTTHVVDGNSFAVSDPIDYRQFFVIADAEVGSKAKHTATAEGSGDTTSYFEVEKLLGSEDITISAHTSLTADINSGVSTVYFDVQLLDKSRGGRVGPLHVYSYRLGPNSASPKMIDVMLNGALVATVPNGSQYEDVQTFPVTLRNGTYEYDLTWDIISSADGKADLTAHTYLEAK